MIKVFSWPRLGGDETMLVQHLERLGDLATVICE